jgi:hypothetical protein
VIVIVEVAIPLAITGDVPTIEEVEATAPVLVKVMLLPVTITGEISWRVLISAVWEPSVHDDCPEALEAEQAP